MTARSARACPLSVEDKLRIAARSTTSASTTSRAASRAPTPRTSSSSSARRGLEARATRRRPAFGATRRKDDAAEDDAGLRALLDTGCEALCIFGKAWDLHVTEALQTTLEENLRDGGRLGGATSRPQGRTVFFDAEHFFDGYKPNAGYAIEVCQAAAEAGADAVVLCDTNGGTLPHEVVRAVNAVALVIDVPLGIHAHNDAGCAVANSLVAVDAGCVQVQGTMNGYGERTGNADLTAIIPALVLKMGDDCVTRDQLRLLTEVSHFVAETANLSPNPHQPYVGASAFAHKGGVHASAADAARGRLRARRPGRGRQPRARRGERAGGPRVAHDEGRGARASTSPATETAAEVLDAIKELEHKGYRFEAADASLEIMLRKETRHLRAVLPSRELPRHRREARGRPGADRGHHQAARRRAPLHRHRRGQRPGQRAGQGAAHRHRALLSRSWREIQLTDYKVRVLDEKKGTGAVTRVLIESNDAREELGHRRRLREHHRGVVGGARRLGRVRAVAPASGRRRSAGIGGPWWKLTAGGWTGRGDFR